MAEHPSRLVLDEWLSGVDSPGGAGPVAAHVAACAHCQSLADELKQARESSLRAPRAPAVLARLEAERRRGETRRMPWRWGAPLVAALAASLALVVFLPRTGDDGAVRLKGTVALRLLSEQGDAVVTARPGERVQLAVGTGPYRQVLVFAVEEGGEVTPMWPPSASQSGEVEPGAQVRLPPALEVTPGSVSLYAVFSDAPLDAAMTREALAEQVTRARARGESSLEVAPPEGVGRAWAHTVLRVLP